MGKGKREMPRKKGRISLFYIILLILVVVILGGIQAVRLKMLQPWLVEFEASQPVHASQQVFEELFACQNGLPDWGHLFDLSGQGDAVVTRDRFVLYMQQHTAGRELTYVETSAGLSGDRKYIVKAGEERVAVFTLTPGTQSAWTLGTVELVMPQSATIHITAGMDYRVLVDGRELGETEQIKIITTAAGQYLPEEIQVQKKVTWQTEIVSSVQPQVEVLDREGNSVPVLRDPEGNCYVELPSQTISPEEEALVVGAAQARAKYMISALTAAGLREYYNPDTPAYKAITSNSIWMQSYSSYRLGDPQVSAYCRYSEDIFSARVALTAYVTRTNSTVREYELDSTFFFRTEDGGKTRVYDMTNLDPQREITQVRLVFLDGETKLEQMFLSSEEHSFVPPAVTPPEGQVFAGWAVREQQGNNITMTIRFQPGEDGTVSLPEGYTLEPMELYAVYENAT